MIIRTEEPDAELEAVAPFTVALWRWWERSGYEAPKELGGYATTPTGLRVKRLRLGAGQWEAYWRELVELGCKPDPNAWNPVYFRGVPVVMR